MEKWSVKQSRRNWLVNKSCGDSRPRLSGGAKLRDSVRWCAGETGELCSPGQPSAAVPANSFE